MRVLAGDIGGTSTRLALFAVDGERLDPIAQKSFPSRDFSGLEQIVRLFLDPVRETCKRACFGIAGPVRNGRSETTNLPWVIEARLLERNLNLDRVDLINDLEANAYGIAALGPDDFKVIHEGEPDAAGNRAIIAAGTGLGEAGLFWDGQRHRPFATEGGHGDFAPTGELEISLLRHLSLRFGRVSWERVLSGPGLVNIYRFLLEHRGAEEDRAVAGEMSRADPAAAISKAGMAGRCGVCVEALDLVVGFYAAEAGNLALKFMATGGLFLGGGIAPKIVEKLEGAAFRSRYFAKGRMQALVESMPAKVILNDRTALLGTARFAVAAAERN